MEIKKTSVKASDNKNKTTEEIVRMFLNKTYNYSEKMVVSRKELLKLEKYYKNNMSKYTDIESFMDSSSEIKEILEKFETGKHEIDKQLRSRKALQPSILFECACIETISKAWAFQHFVDTEVDPATKIPAALKDFINKTSSSVCSARYICCRKNGSTAIIQCGNPNEHDAYFVLGDALIRIEIKNINALATDIDLTYDESGKLIVSDRIKDECPRLEDYINEFNKNLSVIDHMGHNCKLADLTSKHNVRDLLTANFDGTKIDLIVSASKLDELIAFRPSDLSFVFSDNTPLVKTSDSEIRMTGKNYINSAFTPNYLDKVLKEKNVEFNEKTGICRVYNDNKKTIGYICGRGKSKNDITRFKINHAFFVKIEDVSISKDYVEFPKDKIKQSKSGISLHIKINKTKKQIKKELYPARVLAGFCFAA